MKHFFGGAWSGKTAQTLFAAVLLVAFFVLLFRTIWGKLFS